MLSQFLPFSNVSIVTLYSQSRDCNIHSSQGSAAMQLRCGGIINNFAMIAHFLLSVVAKEFLKSVHLGWKLWQKTFGTFNGPRATALYLSTDNIVTVIGCLHDPANVQQTSSRCIQNTRVLLDVCLTSAESLLDRVNTPLLVERHVINKSFGIFAKKC